MTTYSYLPRQHREPRTHHNLNQDETSTFPLLPTGLNLHINHHVNNLLTHLSITPHFIKHLHPTLLITADQPHLLEENRTLQKINPSIQLFNPSHPYQGSPDLIILFNPTPAITTHLEDTWRKHTAHTPLSNTIASLYPSETQPTPDRLTTRYNHYNWTILSNRPRI